MALFLNDQELLAQTGLPHAARVMYTAGIRSRMDWGTGIVGNYPRISWRALVEACYIEPDKHGGGGGRPKQLSIPQARRLANRLEKVGLIQSINVYDPFTKREYLRFRCPLATLKGQKQPQKPVPETSLLALDLDVIHSPPGRGVDRGSDSPKPFTGKAYMRAPDRGSTGGRQGVSTGAVDQGTPLTDPVVLMASNSAPLTPPPKSAETPTPPTQRPCTGRASRSFTRTTHHRKTLPAPQKITHFLPAPTLVQITPDRGSDSPQAPIGKAYTEAPDRGSDTHLSPPKGKPLLPPTPFIKIDLAKNKNVSRGQDDFKNTAMERPTDVPPCFPQQHAKELTMQTIAPPLTQPLIWPTCIHTLQQIPLLAVLSASLQPQLLLDELAGASIGGAIRNPVAYIKGLLRREQLGQFIPDRAIGVLAAREAHENYTACRRAMELKVTAQQGRATPPPQNVVSTSFQETVLFKKLQEFRSAATSAPEPPPRGQPTQNALDVFNER